MKNNNILTGIKKALKLSENDMIEIFKLGGREVDATELVGMLVVENVELEEKTIEEIESDERNIEETDIEETHIEESDIDDQVEEDELIQCDNATLEGFLNGLIIKKRGIQDPKPGKPAKPPLAIRNRRSANNVVFKKMKIAFSLTNEDIVDLMEEVGITITKAELTQLFRKEGHSHYKSCTDRYLNGFLDGISQRV